MILKGNNRVLSSRHVRWLHVFPKAWRRIPSKHLFKESNKRAMPGDEQLTASQDFGVILQRDFMQRVGRRVVQITQHLDKRKHVEVDDFVISMRSFQGGLERAWTSGCIRSSYVVLRPCRDVVPGYFSRLFKSEEYVKALQATANFIRDGQDLSFKNFCLVGLPLPPRDVQAHIAKFLDYETAKIDALIEKQQQLIALLGEKRQAVISHAVTKGLNPDSLMRDSEVEGIGEIPADWKVARIAHVFTKANAGEVIDKSFWGVGAELLYTCNRTPLHSDFPAFPSWKRTLSNDLLLTRNGTPYVHRPVEGSIYSNVVQRISLAKEYSREYLTYCLGNSALGMRGYGVSIESLNFSNWKSLRFAHPSLGEQIRIANFLDCETAKINTLMQKATLLATLLQERRAALVSAAVTGKIDVRGWKLPTSETKAEAP